jgi:hypothetical protein
MDFIVQYSATNSDLQSNNKFSFQGNTVKITPFAGKYKLFDDMYTGGKTLSCVCAFECANYLYNQTSHKLTQHSASLFVKASEMLH